MADIFISYKSERRAAAEHLAGVLGAHGYSVWWDYGLVSGRDFARQIEKELSAAKAVVVLWCSLSRESEWVRQEALYAKTREKTAPVFIEKIELPFGFQFDHTINLADWDGDPQSPALAPLLRDVAALVGRAPLLDAQKLAAVESKWRGKGAPKLTQLPLGPALEAPAREISIPVEKPRGKGVRNVLIAGAALLALGAMAAAFWPRATPFENEEIASIEDEGGLREAADAAARDAGAAIEAATPSSPAVTQTPARPQACAPQRFEIYFEYDSAQISAAARDQIEDVLMRLRRCEITSIEIFGHDETEGHAAYSVQVSQRRANAVRDYLAGLGLSAGLMLTEGRGQSDLAVETGPGVREPLNRRAVVDIRSRLRRE